MYNNNKISRQIIDGFGDEWTRFDQSQLSEKDAIQLFNKYFSIFPWASLPINAVGFDLGCGSGRWAKHVSPHVGRLYCVDPSSAIEVARKNLIHLDNCIVMNGSADSIPLQDGSMDFGYSLGVLHHIPDTNQALVNCVRKLKPGAPFLLYLYYNFENRPLWFRLVWRLSEVIRFVVSRLPFSMRYYISQLIAVLIYYPCSRMCRIAGWFGFNTNNFPLSAYQKVNFYVMRTDALDRFGTRLEHRYSKEEIQRMMENAGLERIGFSSSAPFWCAVGFNRTSL